MLSYWSDIKGFLLLLAILLVVLAIDIGGVAWYNNYVHNFLKEQPSIKSADAGVIFFGDYQDDGAALGPDSKNRAGKAIALFKAKTIRHIINVGGYNRRVWHGKPHLMFTYLEQNGIPADCITYDSLSFNTNTNWREAKKIIEREKYDTVIAISAPLHIYRIACLINDSTVYYQAYTYNPESFADFWQLYLDVHHEWVSHFLSFALRDEARNRIVYFVRSVLSEIMDLF